MLGLGKLVKKYRNRAILNGLNDFLEDYVGAEDIVSTNKAIIEALDAVDNKKDKRPRIAKLLGYLNDNKGEIGRGAAKIAVKAAYDYYRVKGVWKD